jgi:TRAP-type mannitol/chloroaromatic compound transport system permease small subunit
MKWFVRTVDRINEFLGRWIALLILPLIFVVVYEVVARRLFHSPTVWAFEVTVWLYGAHFMLGAAYTHLYDRHVRIDIVAQQLPTRIRLWLNVITFLIIFLPFVGCLTYASVMYAEHSWSVGEHSWSAWKPPLYPYKTVMPVAMIMLLIQGFANFFRDIYRLKGEEI